MDGIEEMQKMLTEHKEDIKEKFKVEEIGIFGSYVRGEEKTEERSRYSGGIWGTGEPSRDCEIGELPI